MNLRPRAYESPALPLSYSAAGRKFIDHGRGRQLRTFRFTADRQTRQRLGERWSADEIVLVDRRTTFVIGLRKDWAVLDARALAEGERPLARLAERGIRVVRGTIGAIHPPERAADVDGDRWDATRSASRPRDPRRGRDLQPARAEPTDPGPGRLRLIRIPP